MARRGAVVDQRMSVFLLEKGSDLGNANFQLERGGHAVEGLHATAGDVLSVLVKIDEAWGDNHALGAENTLAHKWFRRDASNLAITDADITGCVEPRLGVHRTSAFNNEVVLLGQCGGGQQQPQHD